jgi:hypothetical protein
MLIQTGIQRVMLKRQWTKMASAYKMQKVASLVQKPQRMLLETPGMRTGLFVTGSRLKRIAEMVRHQERRVMLIRQGTGPTVQSQQGQIATDRRGIASMRFGRRICPMQISGCKMGRLYAIELIWRGFAESGQKRGRMQRRMAMMGMLHGSESTKQRRGGVKNWRIWRTGGRKRRVWMKRAAVTKIDWKTF